MTNHFSNMDQALPAMADLVLTEGEEVGSRLGETTKELLHRQIVLDRPWQREVLAPHRNANIVAQIAETMWVLAGRDDIEFLGQYLPRAADFSDDGKVWRGAYGPRLRAFDAGDLSRPIDQVKHIVDLLSLDRSSRRAVISIYDPIVDSKDGKDIPCNDFLSFISRNGRLDLSVFVRSNDLMWGWSGINAFEWSALQEIVAGILGVGVGSLVFNTTSLHIYDRHWKRAQRVTESGRYAPTAFEDSPRFSLDVANSVGALDEVIGQWFDLEQKIREGAGVGEWGPKVARFHEPMMRSWLHVIAWYWTGNANWLKPLEGTRLWAATQELPQSIQAEITARYVKPDITERAPLAHKPRFIQFVDDLHRQKSAAYGDSWKKRGELFSIIPNIARKVDRLESGGTTDDETSADTAIDLLVYLIKYRLWLASENIVTAIHPFRSPVDENISLRNVLEFLDTVTEPMVSNTREQYATVLIQEFDALTHTVEVDLDGEDAMRRATIVNGMLQSAFKLARLLWEKENGHGYGLKTKEALANLTHAARNASRAWNPDA